MPKDVIADLKELAQLWPLLGDAKTSNTIDSSSHSCLAHETAPLRISVLDLTREVQSAVTELAAILGLRNPQQPGGIHEAQIPSTIQLIMHDIRERLGSSSWNDLEPVVSAIVDAVLARTRHVLGEEDTATHCPLCQGPLLTSIDRVSCQVCGDLTPPKYMTIREAAEAFGANWEALRKACHRHKLTPVLQVWPPQYPVDQLRLRVRPIEWWKLW